MMMRLGLVILTLQIAFQGCAQSTGVPWQDYATGTQTRIDGLRTARDCPMLKLEFNAADAGNATVMRQTGHNNAALMQYIYDAQTAAACL